MLRTTSAAVGPRRLRRVAQLGSLVRLPARNTLGSVILLSAWDCLAGRCCPYPLEPGNGGYRGMPTSHQGQRGSGSPATSPTFATLPPGVVR
jgi:hypothetical protein